MEFLQNVLLLPFVISAAMLFSLVTVACYFVLLYLILLAVLLVTIVKTKIAAKVQIWRLKLVQN